MVTVGSSPLTETSELADDEITYEIVQDKLSAINAMALNGSLMVVWIAVLISGESNAAVLQSVTKGLSSTVVAA